MQAIFDMFDERVQEINLYFSALKELDIESTSHSSTKPYCNDKFVKILKANTLIMIYNLVESTVMGGILEIYDKLKQDGLTYSGVRKEIKNIWFSYKFRQVYDQQAHFNSYKGKALEIVNSILTGEVIELDRKATAISGNLDAQQIRNVCNEHGIIFCASRLPLIIFQTEAASRGGVVLETVKDRRNDLAHGTLSFAECGRDYSIEDLNDIKAETVLFLKGLLQGMKQYYDEKQYKL